MEGKEIAEDDDLEGQIRRDAAIVQRWGTVLVVAFVALGHVLLGVNWLTQPGLALSGALAGAVLGVIGCAHLLASDVMTRRYRMVITPTDFGSQNIFVGGEVKLPGVFKLPGEIDALQAIMLAGGWTDEGKPTVAADPRGPLALRFREVALRAVGELAARTKDYSRLFPNITVEED